MTCVQEIDWSSFRIDSSIQIEVQSISSSQLHGVAFPSIEHTKMFKLALTAMRRIAKNEFLHVQDSQSGTRFSGQSH